METLRDVHLSLCLRLSAPPYSGTVIDLRDVCMSGGSFQLRSRSSWGRGVVTDAASSVRWAVPRASRPGYVFAVSFGAFENGFGKCLRHPDQLLTVSVEFGKMAVDAGEPSGARTTVSLSIVCTISSQHVRLGGA